MTAVTPRHRADPPPHRLRGDLLRAVARALVGRDLYADDLLLRAESTAPGDLDRRPDSRNGATVVGGAGAGLEGPHALG